MPGHTYWRTITANRKSITKASSSLLDFSSIFPMLGETQARYVNPAARPALASLPHRPLPVAPPLRPFPLPSAPSTPPRRRRRPSPLPSFPAGSALGLLPHTHPPSPLLHPAGPWPPPPRKNPGSLPRYLASRRIPPVPVSALLNSRPPLSGTRCFPLCSLQLPSPSYLAHGTLRGSGPRPLRARELPTRNAGSLGACPVAHRVAAGSGLGFQGSPGGEGRSPRAAGLCKRRLRCPFPRNGGEGAAPRSVALSAGPESPSPVTAGSLEL